MDRRSFLKAGAAAVALPAIPLAEAKPVAKAAITQSQFTGYGGGFSNSQFIDMMRKKHREHAGVFSSMNDADKQYVEKLFDDPFNGELVDDMARTAINDGRK